MPIEEKNGAILITGENSQKYTRMVTLKAMLKLEIIGMKRHGQSAYSIIKKEFGLTGSKQTVLEKFITLIDAEFPNARSAQ